MPTIIYSVLALAVSANAQLNLSLPPWALSGLTTQVGATGMAASNATATNAPTSAMNSSAAATTTSSNPTEGTTGPPAPPPGASILGSPYTVTSLPAKCTGDTTPYQASMWVAGAGLQVDDVAGLWGSKEPVAWTFSTNSTDIVLGGPFYPNANGVSDPKVTPNVSTRTEGSSFIVMMSGDDQGQVMEFNAWDTNGTDFSGWNASIGEQPLPWQNFTWFLNISADMPCAHPQGNSSCASDSIARTPDAWSSYGVDQFLSDWIKNNSASFGSDGFFTTFVKTFGIDNGRSCTIQNQCQLIGNCDDILKTVDADIAPQVYLVLIALQNLSDLLNEFWTLLNIGQSDTMTQIAQLSMQFHYLNGTTTATTPTSAAYASGSLGLASSILGFIPGLSELTPFIGVVNSALGLANTIKSANSSFAFPDSQYAANEASISQYLGDFVQSTRLALEGTYTAMFNDGTNLTQALKGGQVVNRTAINLDCDNCVSQAETNTERYLAYKMVNQMWWQQNAFITFMPYGNITQVDTWQTTTFDESDCASNFLNTPDDKLLTICHDTDGDDFGGFLGPGMARLNWYWPGDPDTREIGNPSNTWGFLNISRGAPGYNSSNVVFNPSNSSSGPVTWKATDVITSSVAGFVHGGFGYDGIADLTQRIIDAPLEELTTDLIKKLMTLDPSTPGMFSIPVCVLTDLNAWPTYWSTYNRVGGDYYSPCYGSTDRHGNKFEDNVSPDLRSIVTQKFYADGGPEPSWPGWIGMGGQQ